jgi:hypothetical protein
VGIVVGMAFVVGRRDGRFEIRESLQSAKGPRARTLANFGVLTMDVLLRAEDRASRPFDRFAVQGSAVRHGAPLDSELLIHPPPLDASSSRFVTASRRFAHAAEKPGQRREDGGVALVQLIDFAEQVARHQPRRAVEPLRYPLLSRLAAERRET